MLPPVVDGERLARLRVDFGDDLADGMVTQFAGMAADAGRRLQRAAEGKDAAAWERVAHDIRGMAATLGLERLAGLCRAIELASAAGRLDEAGRHTEQFEGHLAQAVAALKDALPAKRRSG